MNSTEPSLSSDKPTPEQKRGRIVLLMMFVFFVLPLLIVLAMHQYGWHPEGSSLGELVSPAKPLSVSDGLQDSDSKTVLQAQFRDKWSLVYITPKCDNVCAERLYSMRQLHVALAKDIERVQRVLITQQADVTQLKAQYPDLLIINQPAPLLARFTQQFEQVGSDLQSAHKIYLVDPLANWMMSYPASALPAQIYQDITKLLKFAWAG